jgi:hypothetical protein
LILPFIIYKIGYPERCHNHYFNFNCFRLHYFLFRLPSIFKNIDVVFHLQEYWCRIPFERDWGYHPFGKNCGCLAFEKNWSRLPFPEMLRLSSIFANIEVVFNFQKYWGRLPFSKILRLSSIFKNIEVMFHISSSWVVIRLDTKNQFPRLLWAALNVITWCGVVFFLQIIIPPQQKLF